MKTLKFAAKAHKGQKVPGTDLPYLVHLCLVCMEIFAVLNRKNKINGDLAIQCALLHDTIEDTKITRKQLESDFGIAVAESVQALSKDKSLPKKEQLTDSLRRIKQQPHEVWIVKMADRIANLQKPPFFWTKSKIKSYYQQSCEIYHTLKEADSEIAARLKQKIDSYLHYMKE